MILIRSMALAVLCLLAFNVTGQTCTSGAGHVVYDSNSSAISTHAQLYKALERVMTVSRAQGTARVKTPDIVCTTPLSSSASVSSSSASSSASLSSSSLSSSSVSSSSLDSSSEGSSQAGQTVLYENDFNYGQVPSGDNLYFTADNGGSISVVGGALKGSYPIAAGDGGYYVWGTVHIAAHNTRSVCAEFDTRMPGNKQGLKFYKVFGAWTPETGHANTTFGMSSGTGEFSVVSYGGGEAGGVASTVNGVRQYAYGEENTHNDTHNVLFLDGAYPTWVGRSWPYVTRSAPTPTFQWTDNWHHMKLCVKFHSGTTLANEVPDGAIRVEIDGVVRLDARNIFNRHHLNGPIDRVELFGWSQNGTHPFEVWFDNLKITSGSF